MANVLITPNMDLPNPVTGTDPGPDYANNLNACFILIDQHDHSPGHGVLVTPTGLNINVDLPINNNNLTLVRSVRFMPQGAPISLVTDLSCLYTVTESGSNGDLWFNDASGNQIQITKTGSVLSTISALINGTNEASFVANQLVVNSVQSNGTPANIKFGSALLGNNVSGTQFLTLQPPNAMASSYGVTLPPPNTLGVTAILTYDTSNNILASTPLTAINPSGTITMYGGASAPAGFLLCDGTSYLISAQPTLFAAIGVAYGSADGTHFNVPDFRGVFPRGVTGSSVNDPDASSRTAANAGGNTGNNVGSYQADAFQTHTHFRNPGGNNENVVSQPAGTFAGQGAGSAFQQNLNNVGGNPETGNTTSETRSKNLYVNFIIKT